MEETNRQRKIAGVLQKDLVDVLQKAAQDGMKGVIISVSKVSVTSDLGVAKVYLSIFPSEKRDEIVKGVQSNTILIRHEMAQRTRNQLRRMPELVFFGDDTLDYLEEIDKSLNGEDENPIKNPEILPRRQKR
ncbi:MAG: 30S ribosome-binding factor RbfA [Flavobacteriia bacterium]|nr:30S ribosome-binding factor RbfA [Flavobacteriia bacterium]OIP46285.1 MAG: ribosome-binding factor A [Flavobacteriaceae bacterium CG2_30_31_66]PIV95935.1 MAG: ribosome-binding factor A [Flavobacteriaceae bacterium CG17_big_fil_post_rev_8_21_14_2_50_31_13]PIX13520.1 MAG: ribosome-binding factor A [Flavobacteriaceae bacterium CG_4_8_14_3_um_filter_31_8]PIY16270.1 MAG: ribosome-binding factor A [Flavobacteriaceae bacterium CG_4_10_14_3_um_filter_31_253]PIZ11932.1 MAG: ribosome-binding factor A